MKDDELYKILYNYSGNEKRLPIIPYKDWSRIKKRISFSQFKKVLGLFLINEKSKFPFRNITEEMMKKAFMKLSDSEICSKKLIPNIKRSEIYLNTQNPLLQDYNLLLAITNGNEMNDASNYFHLKNRLACRGYFSKGATSPLQAWKTLELLQRQNWIFFRESVMGKRGISEVTYRESFSLGSYVSSQFKPHQAAILYRFCNAKNILDTSAGWGDRLVAFYSIPTTKIYFGVDPNLSLYPSYKKQCYAYEKLLGTVHPKIKETNYYLECIGKKHVRIYKSGAENVNLNTKIRFDLLFTSPPYFQNEMYAFDKKHKSLQSWYKYSFFDDWKCKFLFTMIQRNAKYIKPKGLIYINITDPGMDKMKFSIVDDLLDFMINQMRYEFQGWIFLREHMRRGRFITQKYSGEPVFCFVK